MVSCASWCCSREICWSLNDGRGRRSRRVARDATATAFGGFGPPNGSVPPNLRSPREREREELHIIIIIIIIIAVIAAADD